MQDRFGPPRELVRCLKNFYFIYVVLFCNWYLKMFVIIMIMIMIIIVIVILQGQRSFHETYQDEVFIYRHALYIVYRHTYCMI